MGRLVQTIGRSLVATLIGCNAAAHGADLPAYTGKELYTHYCAACHGVDAHGDGPVAATFQVMVPDLTQIAKRHGGQYPAQDVHRIVDGRDVHMAHGTRAMPIWGNRFSEMATGGTTAQDPTDGPVKKLVEYLRTIQSH